MTQSEVICLQGDDNQNEDFSNEIVPEPTATTSTATEETQVEDTILPQLEPEELVQLLGEDPSVQNEYGNNIHKDIAPRWTHILTNGLNKDTKSELVKRYLPPENCPNMKPPKLNLEVKAALLESDVKRDMFSQYKQSQLASSPAAIGQVLEWTLDPRNSVPQDITRALSDAGRLICDAHHKESTTRRFAAAKTLNKEMKETVNNTKIDEYLFGSDLAEHIKKSKTISKTSLELKVTQRPAHKVPATSFIRSGALNSRGASRSAAAAPRSAPRQQRQPPPPRNCNQSSNRGRYSQRQTRGR